MDGDAALFRDCDAQRLFPRKFLRLCIGWYWSSLDTLHPQGETANAGVASTTQTANAGFLYTSKPNNIHRDWDAQGLFCTGKRKHFDQDAVVQVICRATGLGFRV